MLLVAEQDEHGDVAWVWFWCPGFRSARPLKTLAKLPENLDQAEVYGASRDEILAWTRSRLS